MTATGQRSHDAHRLDLADTRGFTRAGAGPARRRALADFSARWLVETWAGATQGGPTPGLALAVVGSLARGDGGPLSDYDLVLLHDGRSPAPGAVDAVADRLWYPLWDAGIRLDHSVRTVAQCRDVAAHDLAAAIGLLDLTHVSGDADVVAAARATVAHDWRAGARRRLPDLVAELAARHARHDDLAQSLEPQLKEAHGGLRDMSVLRALTAAWLADRPHGSVDPAHELLLDVRDALHVVTGRGRDRLGREDQDAVAALLGRPSADDLLTDVSVAGRTIAYALDRTLRRAGQSQRARTLRVGPRRPVMNPLGFGLYESDGEVVLGSLATVADDPLVPLRAAVAAARSGLPIAPVTLANLATRSPDLPDPWPPLARDLFADLLAAGPGLLTVWEGLDQAGIVDRWLPEWGAVRSRPQHSPVHRHTVDRHLLETVLQAGGLVRRVGRADLLLLGALLHDIGKRPGAHDHSIDGAPVARAIARRLGHEPADVDLVGRLVREHLTLIDLATRRDHDDPGTVAAALDAVGGDIAVLDLLLALSEADATAAGPKAWTTWRAGLLHGLGERVRARLTDGSRPLPSESAPGPVPAQLRRAVAQEGAQVVVHADGGGWRVDVAVRDRDGLFADTAGLLAAHGLVVRAAALHTVDGVALDRWDVEAPGGAAPDPAALARGLRRLDAGDRGPLDPLRRRRTRRAAPSGAARAIVVAQTSAGATVLEVRADDRPGLLHDLGAALTRAELDVRSAHVATYAAQAVDTFYVVDGTGCPLPPARVAEAVGLLIDACG